MRRRDSGSGTCAVTPFPAWSAKLGLMMLLAFQAVLVSGCASALWNKGTIVGAVVAYYSAPQIWSSVNR